jgi:hypothetical protein
MRSVRLRPGVVRVADDVAFLLDECDWLVSTRTGSSTAGALCPIRLEIR